MRETGKEEETDRLSEKEGNKDRNKTERKKKEVTNISLDSDTLQEVRQAKKIIQIVV